MYLDSDRILKFIGDVKSVYVKTGTADIYGVIIQFQFIPLLLPVRDN